MLRIIQRLYDVRDQRDIVIEVWNSAIWSKNANAIMIWGDMLCGDGRPLSEAAFRSGKVFILNTFFA